MSLRLTPCSSCSRHIRVDAERCPFCAALKTAAPEPALVAPSGRLSSLALMTFRAATLGVAITACGGESDEPAGQGGAGAGGASGSATTGGTTPDTGSGGTSNASGGTIDVGLGGSVDGLGGNLDGLGGSGVPIYRATPRG